MNGLRFPHRIRQLSLFSPTYGCTSTPDSGPAIHTSASNDLLTPRLNRYGYPVISIAFPKTPRLPTHRTITGLHTPPNLQPQPSQRQQKKIPTTPRLLVHPISNHVLIPRIIARTRALKRGDYFGCAVDLTRRAWQQERTLFMHGLGGEAAATDEGDAFVSRRRRRRRSGRWRVCHRNCGDRKGAICGAMRCGFGGLHADAVRRADRLGD